MIAENTQTQMRKGILEYCILSIIGREETYASDIIAELKKARTNKPSHHEQNNYYKYKRLYFSY